MLLFVAVAIFAQAALLRNVPTILIQPNGDTLRCFATGDEFYHRLHDGMGYTIVQNQDNGFYVYAQLDSRGELVPSTIVALSTTLDKEVGLNVAQQRAHAMGIEPNLMISKREYSQKLKSWQVPAQYARPNASKDANTNRGTINNIVIFVRFADDTPISTGFNTINAMFNDSSANAISQYKYFREVSYGQLSMVTYYYPAPNGNTVISVQDSFPRSYYCPYNATTNPQGYQTDQQRATREFDMIERAVNWVNANSPIPTSLNIDYNNDQEVDNIVFVVKGTYTGWSELLWPHKWSVYDRYLSINGKRLYTFNLQLEGSGSHYFSSSTLCHETFHTLGAPDLYRYHDNSDVSPVGSWDLMCSNTTPPQHTSAFMKMTYGNWIDSIPEITASGTYTLTSLADQNTSQNPIRAYAIQSQDPNQYYILEYRNNSNHFETGLPGGGLLIFRADTRYNGNADFDTVNHMDGYYLFRPGGSTPFVNGNVNQAHFGAHVGRPNFSASSSPRPWLNYPYNAPNYLCYDTTLSITNITRSADGNSITFTYNDLRACMAPENLTCSQSSNIAAHLNWNGRGVSYILQYRLVNTPNNITTTTASGRSTILTGLQANSSYEFRVKSICAQGDTSSYSDWAPFFTMSCATPQSETIGTQNSTEYTLPVNTYYNYSLTQQIWTAAEIGGAKNISSIQFYYTHTQSSSSKTNCSIYVGHTTRNAFSSSSNTARNEMVSVNSLTKVYEGDMNCTQGWNTFNFSQPFAYNGTDNLIIVIDDNSGSYNSNQHRFAVQNTTNRMSCYMYSDDSDPDATNPASSSATCTSVQKRAIIQIVGCDPNATVDTFTVTAISANPSMGTVDGGGSFVEGDAATLTATPALGYKLLRWTGPNNFTSTLNPLQVMVHENAQYVAHFALDTFTITTRSDNDYVLTFGDGEYTYGQTATLTYRSNVNYMEKDYWEGPDGEHFDNDTLIINVMSDAEYVLHTKIKRYNVTVEATDPAAGIVSGGGEYEWGQHVEISATANPSYDFLYWTNNLDNTQVNTNPYTFRCSSDIIFTAHFKHTEGIEESDRNEVRIITSKQEVLILGANGQHIQICDVVGRVHYRTSSYDGKGINLPSRGVYFIKIADANAQKVMIK